MTDLHLLLTSFGDPLRNTVGSFVVLRRCRQNTNSSALGSPPPVLLNNSVIFLLMVFHISVRSDFFYSDFQDFDHSQFEGSSSAVDRKTLLTVYAWYPRWSYLIFRTPRIDTGRKRQREVNDSKFFLASYRRVRLYQHELSVSRYNMARRFRLSTQCTEGGPL